MRTETHAEVIDAIDGMVLRPVDIERDAAALAAMWAASDDQWPGTWSSGVPITPAIVRERFERGERIDVVVWDAGGEIAAYCDYTKDPDENIAWISLINVAPAYQSLGLARRMLVHFARRSADLGFSRLDLGTWPGNLKAVPLYKKCGFYWVPDTNVRMMNFLPSILRLTPCRSFFERHDWYTAFRRELEQSEDYERWEDMKVFTYRFEADGETVVVRADREARAITSIETSEVSIDAIAAEVDAPRGLATTIRWRLANRTDRARRASIVAVGDEHLRIDRTQAVELGPQETVTIDGSVDVAAEIPDERLQEWKPAPAVRTVVVVDGEPFELGTGLRPRLPVEVTTHPQAITLAPGVAQEVRIHLRNRLKTDARVSVGVCLPPGLEATPADAVVSFAADGRWGIPVELRADAPGAYELGVSLDVTTDGDRVSVPPQPVSVFALPVGGVLASRHRDHIRVENEHVRVEVYETGGPVGIMRRHADDWTWLGTEHGYPAPPVKPSEYWSTSFELDHTTRDGTVAVTATARSKRTRDLTVRKRIELGAGPWMRVAYEFENAGAAAHELRLVQAVYGPVDTITLPLASGITDGPASDFPGSTDERTKRADAYAERWGARTTRVSTVGIVWPDDTEEIGWHSGFNRLSAFERVPPRGRVALEPLLVYVGDGGWRAVRDLYLRTVGRTPDRHPREPDPWLAVRLEPPIAVTSDEARTAVVVDNRTARPLTGTARMRLPDGWSAEEAELAFEDVSVARPGRADVVVRAPSHASAGEAVVEVRAGDAVASRSIPVVRLGTGGEVEVVESERAGHRILTVRNGVLEADVAPGFASAVVSMRLAGAEVLRSPFPEPGVFSWWRPWHGGIMPILATGGYPGRMHRETWTAEPVTVVDDVGRVWRGVRTAASASHPDDAGLDVEMDVVTLGGSPVLRTTVRVRNRTSVVRRRSFGFMAFPAGDGIVAVSEDRRLLPTDRMIDAKAGSWAAAGGLVVAAREPDVVMSQAGPSGVVLGASPHLTIAADGASEVTAYVIAADDATAWGRALATLT